MIIFNFISLIEYILANRPNVMVFCLQIESEAAASEETLNNATQRIANLEKSLGELLKMSAANSATLNSIEKSSEDAKANADGIKKVSSRQTMVIFYFLVNIACLFFFHLFMKSGIDFRD